MKTTVNLLLAASPAMAELAAHLPLSLPSLGAGVYFFPVSTSARTVPGRLAYGAPIRVADPVGVWAVEAPATSGASPAACRPADVRDAADDGVARRCDGAGPGGLLVSMKDSGIAFACYCGASEDDGTEQMTATGVQRGWNKRGDDDAQRGWNKRGDDDAQRGWNKRAEAATLEPEDQRGWNKRHADDQRGWNRVSAGAATLEPEDQRGWNKRTEAAALEPEDQRGWNKRAEATTIQPEDQRGWNKRAEAAAVEPEDQRGWNKRADDAALQPEDQRGWNKRSNTDKPIQATSVKRGWQRRAMAQRGML